jgi:predicted ATP-grasp superfamily ATP-dependent carboligase
VFVAAHGKAVWLGATQQLIGTAWTGARGFEYAGSLGPLETSPDRRTQWGHIGSGLARRFALSGLFGVDAVMTDDAIWVVEVNPRYTASVEVIELACDLALLRPHVRACESGTLPTTDEVHPQRRVGKAIVYAQKQGCVPADFRHFVQRLNTNPIRPTVADIPAVGQEFRSGEPLVTVLAYAESTDEAARSLQPTVASAQAALHCV